MCLLYPLCEFRHRDSVEEEVRVSYRMVIEKVEIPGQRPRYCWTLYDEENRWVLSGDTYFKWNAKRAARRAASRHHNGHTLEPEVYEEEIIL